MVSLCRDFHFELFKMDAVCGQLRPSKYDAFDRMMTECRKYSPDLVLLNHRLQLGPGTRHSTTYLLGGAETYIDVHMANDVSAPHHRVTALARELPPGLTRLTEDHGVCLSSCLDYWEDDLVLQAFNRSLILAPELYGNPWLLRDDEYPRLAAIFNLHRRYRDILVNGLVLPAADYGLNAVSRGDAHTRFLTLRNLSWEPVTYTLSLDGSIGLAASDRVVRLTQFHPWTEALGEFAFGTKTTVKVLPFRSCLVRLTNAPADGWEIEGCAYEVVRDVPGQPVEIKLLAPAGTSANVRLRSAPMGTTAATLDGCEIPALLRGEALPVTFAGEKLRQPWHRRLAVLEPVDVPADAMALYEATCFAADNNALEVRALARSGPSRIPAVQRAREAFLGQPLFAARGLWDAALFDGDAKTAFSVDLRWGDPRQKGGAFRLDLGAVQTLDELVLETPDEFALQPLKSEEGVVAEVSADLRTWREIRFRAGQTMHVDLRQAGPWRYLRFAPTPLRLTEVRGFVGGQSVDRSHWRTSNLFAPYVEQHWQPQRVNRAQRAWTATVTLDQIAPGSYLCVAVNGEHGYEGATAAFRIDGRYVGCPDRSPSFPANCWEVGVRGVDRNNTFYLPLTSDLVGKKIEAVVLALNSEHKELAPEMWITAYPAPFATQTLVLHR
jgi:hypothetical protein